MMETKEQETFAEHMQRARMRAEWADFLMVNQLIATISTEGSAPILVLTARSETSPDLIALEIHLCDDDDFEVTETAK